MVKEMTLGMSGGLFRQRLSCSPKGRLDHPAGHLGTMTQFNGPPLPSHAHQVTERDVDAGEEHTHENTHPHSSACDFP